MGHDRATRRRVASAIGAALISPAAFAARGQFAAVDLRHESPSRMTRREAEDYTPPSDLKMVADIYRRVVEVQVPTGPLLQQALEKHQKYDVWDTTKTCAWWSPDGTIGSIDPYTSPAANGR